MKALSIPFLENLSTHLPIATVQQSLDVAINRLQPIDCLNWPEEYPDKPEVGFKLARISDGLVLKFEVHEAVTSAKFTEDNQRVYKDSCVELFIDPAGDGTYYNFEFNALGTLLLGFGADRHQREQGPAAAMNRVIRHASLGTTPFEKVSFPQGWQLTVMIPYSAFWHHSIATLAGQPVRANLQKCGDDLPTPHYLSWNPIPSPHPDFHRPEDFGILSF